MITDRTLYKDLNYRTNMIIIGCLATLSRSYLRLFYFLCFVLSCWDVNSLAQLWILKTLENIFISFPLMVWELSRCKSWQAVRSRFRKISSVWSFYHESLMCVALYPILAFSKVLKISEEHCFSFCFDFPVLGNLENVILNYWFEQYFTSMFTLIKSVLQRTKINS